MAVPWPPTTRSPQRPIPAEWPQGPSYKDSRNTAEAQAAWKLSWQAFFTDPKLQQIIETALNNNRDLRLALLNVEKAAALYGIQKAELFPSINAAGVMSSQRIPADLSSSGAARTQDQYSVNLGVASWEIDFFGRIRSLKDSALENYLATDEARRSAQILLIAATAGAYLNLAADRENLNLAKTTLQTQQDVYRIINRRYEVGLANEVDVNRSQTQVDTARGDIARFTQQIALDENALNLLLGSPAPAEVLSASLSDILEPPGCFFRNLFRNSAEPARHPGGGTPAQRRQCQYRSRPGSAFSPYCPDHVRWNRQQQLERTFRIRLRNMEFCTADCHTYF